MNTNTPIFEFHKIQHFVRICEKSLFEISTLREPNHLITKANDWRNIFKQNEYFSCTIVVVLDQNVKTYLTTQFRFSLILKMGVAVLICAFSKQCNV